MNETIYRIAAMDCPSEENLIKLKLADFDSIVSLKFDIPNRRLSIFHEGDINEIEQSLLSLKLGAEKISTEEVHSAEHTESLAQKRTLWIVLAINFTFFILEIVFGLVSNSMGLVADSLDMLADSFVYGLSLVAVGTTQLKKKRVARIAGYFQFVLAAVGFIEVLRRFFTGENLPDFTTMIVVSLFALIANAVCLYVLQMSKGKEEAHMKASMIFTSNDIIINLGVICAGACVFWLESNKPDLIIGAIVFVLVVQGAQRILKLA